MRPRSIVLLVAVVFLTAFAGLNWQSLLATTPISLLLFEIDAPLGLILLLVVALMTVLFLGLVAYLEAQARQERKRLSKEIDHWKELAEKAEVSRIQELRESVEAGFDDLYDRLQGLGAQTLEAQTTELEDPPADNLSDSAALPETPASNGIAQ